MKSSVGLWDQFNLELKCRIDLQLGKDSSTIEPNLLRDAEHGDHSVPKRIYQRRRTSRDNGSYLS